MDPTSVDILQNTVIEQGFCVGCGVCRHAADSPFRIVQDGFGRYLAAREPERESTAQTLVCPFMDGMPLEDSLAAEFLDDAAGMDVHPAIGHFGKTWAGHVAEDAFRTGGSSGGMGSWLSVELLQRDLVDAIVHVAPTEKGAPVLFEYTISTSVDAVRAGSKSRYYPVELSQVLQEVIEGPERRYAVVALPCFAKAIRLLSQVNPIVRRRVRFIVGLVCGHLKSAAFAELMGWQCGIPPGHLEAIDFRVKEKTRTANRYAIRMQGHSATMDPVDETQLNSSLFGQDWGMGLMKYQACDYCDDVTAETADVCIGDAWLPEFVTDPQGTNLVITRNPAIEGLIVEAIAAGRLALTPLSREAVAASQDAGLRHRRDGLAYRLFLRVREGLWAPTKRVQPRDDFPERVCRVQELRLRLSATSHVAFAEARQAADLQVFRRRLAPLVDEYNRLYGRSLRPRLKGLLKRLLGRS